MISLFYIFLLGIILSIDAFCVCLNIGWQLKNRNKEVLLPILIGIFHFLLSLSSCFFACHIRNLIKIDNNDIMGIILIFIGLLSLFNLKEEKLGYKLTIFPLICIALSVSIDSFSMAIALVFQKLNILICGIIFSICSCTISYLGLILSKYLSNRFEKRFKLFGIVLLLFLGIIHILK